MTTPKRETLLVVFEGDGTLWNNQQTPRLSYTSGGAQRRFSFQVDGNDSITRSDGQTFTVEHDLMAILDQLQARGIQLGLVNSSSKFCTDGALEAFSLDRYFCRTVAGVPMAAERKIAAVQSIADYMRSREADIAQREVLFVSCNPSYKSPTEAAGIRFWHKNSTIPIRSVLEQV